MLRSLLALVPIDTLDLGGQLTPAPYDIYEAVEANREERVHVEDSLEYIRAELDRFHGLFLHGEITEDVWYRRVSHLCSSAQDRLETILGEERARRFREKNLQRAGELLCTLAMGGVGPSTPRAVVRSRRPVRRRSTAA
jgi:hypothetical protein